MKQFSLDYFWPKIGITPQLSGDLTRFEHVPGLPDEIPERLERRNQIGIENKATARALAAELSVGKVR